MGIFLLPLAFLGAWIWDKNVAKHGEEKTKNGVIVIIVVLLLFLKVIS